MINGLRGKEHQCPIRDHRNLLHLIGPHGQCNHCVFRSRTYSSSNRDGIRNSILLVDIREANAVRLYQMQRYYDGDARREDTDPQSSMVCMEIFGNAHNAHSCKKGEYPTNIHKVLPRKMKHETNDELAREDQSKQYRDPTFIFLPQKIQTRK